MWPVEKAFEGQMVLVSPVTVFRIMIPGQALKRSEPVVFLVIPYIPNQPARFFIFNTITCCPGNIQEKPGSIDKNCIPAVVYAHFITDLVRFCSGITRK